MSTCISKDGEYGSHAPDDRFCCTRCFALDEEGVLAALDEARADRDAEALRADDLSHEIVTCDRLDLLARAVAAESALAAVQALVGSVGPRSATAGSPYSTGRWDAFAEVRAALDGETEDGVFGDPDIHARLTRAALNRARAAMEVRNAEA